MQNITILIASLCVVAVIAIFLTDENKRSEEKRKLLSDSIDAKTELLKRAIKTKSGKMSLCKWEDCKRLFASQKDIKYIAKISKLSHTTLYRIKKSHSYSNYLSICQSGK